MLQSFCRAGVREGGFQLPTFHPSLTPAPWTGGTDRGWETQEKGDNCPAPEEQAASTDVEDFQRLGKSPGESENHYRLRQSLGSLGFWSLS